MVANWEIGITARILKNYFEKLWDNSNLRLPQLVPLNPEGHWQLYPLTKSMQIPPLRQGLLSHSFMSKENIRRVKV